MSRLEQVLQIRKYALDILNLRGNWTTKWCSTRLLAVEFNDFEMLHRTPFQPIFKLTDGQKYAFALTGRTRKPNFPYGLDIWYGPKKVLNLEWDDSGAVNILSFRRGHWEKIIAQVADAETEELAPVAQMAEAE
jgi:hypothetical protein